LFALKVKKKVREDVLGDPGERDITALEECGAACGLRRERFETLARTP
jgi:hypothetical protein